MAPETDRDQADPWQCERDEELQTRLQAAVNSYKEWAEARDHAAAGQREIYHVLEEVVQKLASEISSGHNGRCQLSSPGGSLNPALGSCELVFTLLSTATSQGEDLPFRRDSRPDRL